jgi:hypothetical protein
MISFFWQTCRSGRRKFRRLDLSTTSFRHVEAALVRAYNVHPDDVGAFRARLTFLQKKGLLGPENRPGRGKAIAYGPDQFWRMIYACEIGTLGMTPNVTLWFIENCWPKLREGFQAAEEVVGKHKDPNRKKVLMQISGFSAFGSAWRTAEPNVRWIHLRAADKWFRNRIPTEDISEITVNISARLRDFYSALEAVKREAGVGDRFIEKASKPKRRLQRKGKVHAEKSRTRGARRAVPQIESARSKGHPITGDDHADNTIAARRGGATRVSRWRRDGERSSS